MWRVALLAQPAGLTSPTAMTLNPRGPIPDSTVTLEMGSVMVKTPLLAASQAWTLIPNLQFTSRGTLQKTISLNISFLIREMGK